MAADGELVLITAHSSFPVAPKQFCFWVRRDSSPLSPATVKAGVQFGMVNGGGVDSLLRVMGDVFAPQVTGSGAAAASWPDSVRKDFVSQLQRCMASLVEASHVAKGKTVLYLPPEEGLGGSDAEAAALVADRAQLQRLALDKDLLQRLEACVIHWTHQVKEVVSNQVRAAAPDSAPRCLTDSPPRCRRTIRPARPSRAARSTRSPSGRRARRT